MIETMKWGPPEKYFLCLCLCFSVSVFLASLFSHLSPTLINRSCTLCCAQSEINVLSTMNLILLLPSLPLLEHRCFDSRECVLFIWKPGIKHNIWHKKYFSKPRTYTYIQLNIYLYHDIFPCKSRGKLYSKATAEMVCVCACVCLLINE